MTQAETQGAETDAEDRLGMTDAQWAQWQAYTHGYGEQDANGIDISLIRENLRFSPWERLAKLQRNLFFSRRIAWTQKSLISSRLSSCLQRQVCGL